MNNINGNFKRKNQIHPLQPYSCIYTNNKKIILLALHVTILTFQIFRSQQQRKRKKELGHSFLGIHFRVKKNTLCEGHACCD